MSSYTITVQREGLYEFLQMSKKAKKGPRQGEEARREAMARLGAEKFCADCGGDLDTWALARNGGAPVHQLCSACWDRALKEATAVFGAEKVAARRREREGWKQDRRMRQRGRR